MLDSLSQVKCKIHTIRVSLWRTHVNWKEKLIWTLQLNWGCLLSSFLWFSTILNSWACLLFVAASIDNNATFCCFVSLSRGMSKFTVLLFCSVPFFSCLFRQQHVEGRQDAIIRCLIEFFGESAKELIKDYQVNFNIFWWLSTLNNICYSNESNPDICTQILYIHL